MYAHTYVCMHILTHSEFLLYRLTRDSLLSVAQVLHERLEVEPPGHLGPVTAPSDISQKPVCQQLREAPTRVLILYDLQVRLGIVPVLLLRLGLNACELLSLCLLARRLARSLGRPRGRVLVALAEAGARAGGSQLVRDLKEESERVSSVVEHVSTCRIDDARTIDAVHLRRTRNARGRSEPWRVPRDVCKLKCFRKCVQRPDRFFTSDEFGYSAPLPSSG